MQISLSEQNSNQYAYCCNVEFY